MKCEFCMGNMQIEDAVCPNCGKPNPFYEAHRKDMDKFKKQFETTKYEAIETNVRHTRKAVQISIIAVLVALILASALVLLSMDDIYDSLAKSRNRKNADAIIATLRQYEDEKDFYNFKIFYDAHYEGMYSYGYAEFSSVDTAVSSFDIITSVLAGIVMDDNYNDYSDNAQTINRFLKLIYTERENAAKNNTRSCYSDKHMESVDYILNDIYVMFKAYLAFSDEEIAELENLSEAERILVFEKKFKGAQRDEE